MTPDQFLARMKRGDLPPACLFLGQELFNRDRCRAALIQAALSLEEREEGLARFDLSESSLQHVIDDARSLSLFAPRRVIVATGAEAALPRMRAAEPDEGSETDDAGALVAYLKDPTPGVVILFEATEFDFEGDEKKKLERVGKFYSAVPAVVELRRFSAHEALDYAQTIAGAAGLNIDSVALDLLVESLGADVARIAVEVEKLRLLGRPVGVDEIAELVPDARATTIFALVNALGRRDRARSLGILETLTREGEYLPLALSFLATQFRLALIARESGLRTAPQIQSHFSRVGVPMWGSRAAQVSETSARFSTDQLARGIRLIFEADRDLRSPRPDDRIVMERLILALTSTAPSEPRR